MNCRTAKKQILARLDEVLSPELEATLQEHLKVCAGCAHAAQENDLAFQWLQEAPDARPSENFEWRLKLRLAELDRTGARVPLFDRLPARSLWTLRFSVSAAAAAALVLSVGFVRIQRDSTAPAPPDIQAQQQAVPRLVSPNPLTATQSVRQVPTSDYPALGWPRPVPVRYGEPLGPQYLQTPAPSILGPTRAEADTILPQTVGAPIPPR